MMKLLFYGESSRDIKDKMKKIKYIKLNKISESELVSMLHDWIIRNTNAGLISLELNRHCWKFAKGLKDIPLSTELQD
jgi:hypothetical protein